MSNCFAANDDHHKCSSPFNDNEECSEGNDSVKTKDASTLTAVVGEEIEAIIKECILLRRDLAECETKLKAAELWISSVIFDDKNIQVLLHTRCLRHVMTFLDLL